MIYEEPGQSLCDSVLVLNRFYLAVHVISVRRAFCLLYCASAEVIHIDEGQYANYDFETWRELSELCADEGGDDAEGDWVRTVSAPIRIPRVIRLTQFDRVPKQTLRFNRRNLFARDNHECQYCGKRLPNSQLSIDHVMPRSRGGKTTWDNIVCCCLNCNTKKGGRTPDEARMRLRNPPKKPRHNPWLAVKLSNPKYASWRTFLPEAAAGKHRDQA